MYFGFTDTQKELVEALGDVLSGLCAPTVVRSEWEKPGSTLPTLWTALGDLGLLGTMAPEAVGGLGGTQVEMALLFEQCGRFAVPGPLVEHVAVAVPVVAADAAKLGDTLADLLSGAAIATATEPTRVETRWAAESTDVLVPNGAEWSLVSRPHVDSARGPGSVDRSITYGVVRKQEGSSLGEFSENSQVLQNASVAISAQLIGLADHLIRTTSAYVRERTQFGTPVGSQQAIKHKLADALIQLEHARPVVYRAAYALAHEEDTRFRDLSHARISAVRSAETSARCALQCHGAIGYTWEYDLHMWIKRVKALSNAWGSLRSHEDRLFADILTTAGQG